MFSKLLDMAGIGNIRWKRIVQTFKLVYPSVIIEKWRLENDKPPAAFLVIRGLDGRYLLELLPSKEKALDLINENRENKYTYNGTSSASFPIPPISINEITSNETYWNYCINSSPEEGPDFHGHLIDWGLFSYDCQYGIGEFCLDRFGCGGPSSFAHLFVLREDRKKFIAR